MSTVVVTGGAGYIGSHTCKALSKSGFTPVVIDNLSEGHAEFVKWGPLIELDIRDTEVVAERLKELQPYAVIHFAASAYVGESNKNPQKYYDNNLIGSLSLLDAMQQAAVKNIVFSSTCAVYGEAESLPIDENTQLSPISPYGRSKRMVEQILEDSYRAVGINSVSLRYFNAAGADLDGEIGERHSPEPHLIPNVIEAALNSTSFNLNGIDYPTDDGTCVRDYVHVSDLAAAHLAALNYLRQKPGFHHFNVGAGRGYSIRQIIDEVERQTDSLIKVSELPRRAGDPACLYADISLTQQALRWQPEVSEIETILSSAIRWARQERR